MWFKNIQIFQLVEPFTLTPEQLQALMVNHASRPCGKLERMHYGWVSPLGQGNELLVHALNGRYLIAARKEEKILPASVVREYAAVKIKEMEENENRKLTSREKRNVSDQVMVSLLPQALSKSQTTFAYLDTVKNWLIVDASNRTRADDLTVLLRNTLGSFKLAEINLKHSPAVTLTSWLATENLPRDFTLEDYCEMQDPNAASTVIKCVNQDLTAKEVLGHLESGKQVIKLALSWSDRLTYIIDSALSVRRIRFLDLVQQQVDDSNTESESEKFDADFLIFTAEFAEFLPRLWEAMGGHEEA
ncbi:MAG: recombination-associated protein RdgC [Legionellales bacterium]|nr:recombination-associated protein RdgC [Legionellales bacterium]